MMLDARITGMSQFLQLTLFQSLLPLISDCPREFTLNVEIRVRAPPRSHHVVRDKMVNHRRISKCNICGYEGPRSFVVRHIEANHITGVSHPCEICGKSAR